MATAPPIELRPPAALIEAPPLPDPGDLGDALEGLPTGCTYAHTAPGEVLTVVYGWDVRRLRISSRDGAGEVFFTTNGTVPEIEGPGTEILLARIGSSNVEVSNRRNQAGSRPRVVVRFISAEHVSIAIRPLS